MKVEAAAGDVASKDAEFYKQFRLVVVSNRSYEEQMKINDHCRSAGTMFVSCDVYGLCGYVFADLLDGFTYAEYAPFLEWPVTLLPSLRHADAACAGGLQ